MVESWVFFYIEDGWNYLMGSGYGNSFSSLMVFVLRGFFLLFLPPFYFLYRLAFLGGNYFEVMLLTIFLPFLFFLTCERYWCPLVFSLCVFVGDFHFTLFSLYGDVVDTIWTRRLREIS